jgi:predicted RNase H-like HicB family nuclease
MQLEWTFRLRAGTRRDDQAGVFVSHCPGLRLFSQGRSADEAKDALKSAIKLYLTAHLRRRTLDDKLGELGFNPAAIGDGDRQPMSEEEYIILQAYPDKYDIEVPLSLTGECAHP